MRENFQGNKIHVTTVFFYYVVFKLWVDNFVLQRR